MTDGSDVSDSRDWSAGVKIKSGLLLTTGLAGTIVFLAGFGAWAAYAPLAAAVMAPGFVAAAGQNQVVRHLDGGVVTEVVVREGDRVASGQTLFELDATAARANRDALGKKSAYLAVRALRLAAERDEAAALSFPTGLQDEANRWGVGELLAEQEKEFSVRLEGHRQERIILQQRTQALKDQIEGLSAQQLAVERQLEVVRDERARKKGLLDRGLTDRSEYSELLRSEAALVGQLGQVRSGILSSQTQIVEAQAQFSRLITGRVERAATELNQVRTEIATVEEQLLAADAVLDRTVVRAPSDGIVIRTRVNVAGSVVRPGEEMLELLPVDDELVVEARLAPAQVDLVATGQTAMLRFSALDARVTPEASAKVIYVSADRLLDPGTQQAFYTARLAIDGALPTSLPAERLYPGLPVEVFIGTGDRTFLEYLAKPITDSFTRAFRDE